MTAEKVDPPHPFHRPPPSRNPISGGSWGGRVSDHRRAQVRARGPEAVPQGPTGPVDSTRRHPAPAPGTRSTTDTSTTAPTSTPTAPTHAAAAPEVPAPVAGPWSATFEGLHRDLRSLSAVLLCTVDGRPVASWGVAGPDEATACWQTAAAWTAIAVLDATRRGPGLDGVETVQLAAGLSQTVVARVATPGQGHLLSVSAEGTTPAVLLLKTRQAAYELRQALNAGEPGR